MIIIHQCHCARNLLELQISVDPDQFIIDVIVKQLLSRKENPIDPSLMGTHECSSAEEMYGLYHKIASQLFSKENNTFEFESFLNPVEPIDIKKWHENLKERSRELFDAVAGNDPEAIGPWLSEKGENVINLYNRDGETPLTQAVKLNQREVVYELLRSMFLDREKRNRSGKNAVEIALEQKNSEMVRTLLSMGWHDIEVRLDYIMQSGLELPDPETSSLKMAELVLEKVPDLSDEQRNAYRGRIDSFLAEPDKLPADFDIGKMIDEYSAVVNDLADKSGETVFAAFAMDGGVCSLGTAEEIKDGLRPPDWSFHHELSEGFDFDAYDDHYNASDEEQKTSEYTAAMKEFLRELEERNVFDKLKKTDNFSLSIVEHIY